MELPGLVAPRVKTRPGLTREQIAPIGARRLVHNNLVELIRLAGVLAGDSIEDRGEGRMPLPAAEPAQQYELMAGAHAVAGPDADPAGPGDLAPHDL